MLSLNAAAQNKEFPVYDNGLIYRPHTMDKLSFIVDSLNLRFKTCDLHKTYRSVKQTRGHHVFIETSADDARKDLAAGISFDSLLKKYPGATVEQDVVITATASEKD